MAFSNPDRPQTANQVAVICAASFLTAINTLVVNVQPIIMGALADGRGLTDAGLGQIGAIFVGFNALCTLSAPLWLRSVNWRTMSFLGLTAAIAITLSGAWAQTLATLLLVFAALGLAKGLLGALAFAALGETDNPDRAFGAAVAGQSLLAAVAAVPLSAWIVPRYGVVGLFCALAALLCAGFAACVWMPVRGRGGVSVKAGSAETSSLVSAAAVPPLVALLASGLFVAGIMGFWYFMERIGTARGSSAGWVGLAVSLAAVASIVSAAVVTWLGARWPSLAYVFGGTAMVLAGFALLSLPGDSAFMSACLLFALGWGLAQPAYWAVVRKVDATNRLFAAAPAASSAGAVIVGLAAGPIIAQGGYGQLVGCSAALIAAAAICLVVSEKLPGRATQAAPAT